MQHAYHDNFHEVEGVGLTSGETLVASGGTNGIVLGVWYSGQWVGTTISQMKVIGKNTRFTITFKYHITVTPDGNVTINSREQTIDGN